MPLKRINKFQPILREHFRENEFGYDFILIHLMLFFLSEQVNKEINGAKGLVGEVLICENFFCEFCHYLYLEINKIEKNQSG